MVNAKLVIKFVSGIIGSATMDIAGSTSEILEHAKDMYEANAMIRTIEVTVDGVIIHTVNYDLTSASGMQNQLIENSKHKYNCNCEYCQHQI